MAALVADRNNVRLKTTETGMKMFTRVEDMAAIPKIGRSSAVHTTDQIVSMASRRAGRSAMKQLGLRYPIAP